MAIKAIALDDRSTLSVKNAVRILTRRCCWHLVCNELNGFCPRTNHGQTPAEEEIICVPGKARGAGGAPAAFPVVDEGGQGEGGGGH